MTIDPSLEKWNIIGRYDDWKLDDGEEKESTIAGVAYQWNKNVEFILNYDKYTDTRVSTTDNELQRVLFTAEVTW
ncbi:Phosphate-selective porin O and P [compost metagenome]